MKLLSKYFFYLFLLSELVACSDDDDDNPSTSDLIKAHPWRVDNFDVQASSAGVPVAPEVIAPFVDNALDDVPLNGIITFEEGTFTVDDQGTTLEGTWSLSADEMEITMTFSAGGESFTFEIREITADTFNLALTTSEDFVLVGGVLTLDLEITAFLIPN